MPSPFPGMNPYLERASVWHDFHGRFVPAIAEAVGSQMADQFVVRIDDHVYIHEPPADQRRLIGRPDVGVSTMEPTRNGGGIATIEAPAQVDMLDIDEERISYVEIRDRDSWKVITVIELVSPANKYQGPDREQYLGKRRHITRSATHFVEIDLLRGGPPLPLTNRPDCDYSVMVSRWQNRPRADFWPIGLRDRLPTIPIPLAEGFADVSLDLQTVLHRVYDAARYGNYVYRGAPEPLLEPADQEWARSILAMN